MRVLLTGCPGFLGNDILEFFTAQGAVVDTLSRSASVREKKASHLVVDLSREIPPLSGKHYDLVIHAAGKAHAIPRTKNEAREFVDSNITGTRHLLQAMTEIPPSSLLFISSVAVYGREHGDGIDENSRLNATDPYGLSKIQAEKLILDTEFTRPVIRGIVRLPLIAGTGPPGNLGSMLTAMRKGVYFNIGKGDARRSVVLRSDVAPFLNELAKKGGVYNLTDGRDLSFAELYKGITNLTGYTKRPAMPKWIAHSLAELGEIIQKISNRSFPFNRRRFKQMTQSLTFDSSAAQRDFSFCPRIVVEHLADLLHE